MASGEQGVELPGPIALCASTGSTREDRSHAFDSRRRGQTHTRPRPSRPSFEQWAREFNNQIPVVLPKDASHSAQGKEFDPPPTLIVTARMPHGSPISSAEYVSGKGEPVRGRSILPED